jgi:hypothetical protein
MPGAHWGASERGSGSQHGPIHPCQHFVAPALFDCFGERTPSISNLRGPECGGLAEFRKGSILEEVYFGRGVP